MVHRLSSNETDPLLSSHDLMSVQRMAMEEQANNVNRFLLILGLGGDVVMEQYGWVRARCVHGGDERANIEHYQWHKASDDVRPSNSFGLASEDSVCLQCLIGA